MNPDLKQNNYSCENCINCHIPDSNDIDKWNPLCEKYNIQLLWDINKFLIVPLKKCPQYKNFLLVEKLQNV